MGAYRELPAYDDVPASLELLKNAGHRLYPFSNGTAEMVSAVLEHAGIQQYFEDVISVDSLRTYKPDPQVYQHVVQIANVAPSDCWLVSSNGFDVIGAISAGMPAAWLKRFDGVVFDPWGIEPTRMLKSLAELADAIN
jgi:2-haloacid dehalogenase